MTDLRGFFAQRQQAMIELLNDYITYETFTTDKARVDDFIQDVQTGWEKNGAQVERIPRQDVGDVLLGKWNTDAPGKPLLLLGHADTVWAAGTLAQRPAHQDGEGRLYGPGALDMKGGLVVGLHAILGLRDIDQLPDRPIWYLLTTDEEIGSKQSRQLIEETAKQCDLVLVLEPPTADGALKTWRKGVATYKLTVEGRAAHAGNEPEQGINAIIEFAQQAVEINKLNDYKMGTSVSLTVVDGGSATNVIPASLTAYIDTRTMTLRDKARVEDALMNLHPFIPGAKVTMELRSDRPPMERNPAVFDRIRGIANGVGIEVREDGAGGGSDGNFTAALGIPTIDGLGAEGQGLHAVHEHVLVNSLPKKAALIAAILRDW